MSDAQIFWSAFFAFLTALVVGLPPILVALAKIRKENADTRALAQATHNLVNSRMDELLKITKESAKAKGKIEGIAEEKGKGTTPTADPQAVVVVNLPHEPVPTVEGEQKDG